MGKKLRVKCWTYFWIGFLVALMLFSTIDLSKEKLSEPNKGVLKGEANVVAVSNTGKGILGNVIVEVKEGEGKILINTNPFLEPDTQFSANIAVKVAGDVTKKDLSKRDVIFDFDIGRTGVVGGPSAGASMALALISALEGKDVKKNVAVTGTIMPDGNIGQIGSIAEKAEISSQLGIKTFIVPKGQSIFTYYEKEIRKKVGKGFTLYNTYYIPKEVNLTRYYEEQSRMKIKEVKNINEIMKIVF